VQRALRREIVVDGRVGDSGAVGDQADGGALIAALSKEPTGDCEDSFTRGALGFVKDLGVPDHRGSIWQQLARRIGREEIEGTLELYS